MGKIIYDNVGDVSLLNLCEVWHDVDQTPLPTTEAAKRAEIQERLREQRTRAINYSQPGKPPSFLFGRKQAQSKEDA